MTKTCKFPFARRLRGILAAVLSCGLLGLFTFCEPEEKKYASGPILGYLKLDDIVLEISEIANGLEVPWDLDASRSGELWLTEVSGKLHRLDLNTLERNEVLQLEDVLAKKSYGLLGMAVHPQKDFIFLHYTFGVEKGNMEEAILSRLVRYELLDGTLANQKVLMDSLPGNTFHNGSRVLIDGDFLYFSLGDVGRVQQAQSPDFLGGKIMRIDLEGNIPEDNPFPNSPVWAMGLRNSQGMTMGEGRKLYASDHGPINDDEINLIEVSGNYGWPDVAGYCDTPGETAYCDTQAITEPLKAWTPTIATAGLAYYGDSKIAGWKHTLLLASMKGRSLRVLHLNETGNGIVSEDILFQNVFGRIRDVVVGHEGEVYFSTSNLDWHPRFQPWMYDSLPDGDDRILRLQAIAPEDVDTNLPLYHVEKEQMELKDEKWSATFSMERGSGKGLYATHCLACHAPDGKGAEGLIPPLANTPWVTGDKGKLIRTLLLGLSGEIEVNGNIYNQEMPGFAHLSDEELAEILSFIRNEFGNTASAVIPGEVFEERKGVK